MKDHFYSQIHRIFNEIFQPLVSDPSPMVRWALCTAIGQLCIDFEAKFKKDLYQQIADILTKYIQEDTDIRFDGSYSIY